MVCCEDHAANDCGRPEHFCQIATVQKKYLHGHIMPILPDFANKYLIAFVPFGLYGSDMSRIYAKVPDSLAPKVADVAKRLGQNPNQLVTHCVEGCLAAIDAEKPEMPPIVVLARRVLDKHLDAADRLLVSLISKTLPSFQEGAERYRQLVIEEAKKIEGELTLKKLRAAADMASERLAEEQGILSRTLQKVSKLTQTEKQRHKWAQSK